MKHRHRFILKNRCKGAGGLAAIRFKCSCSKVKIEVLAARHGYRLDSGGTLK